MVTVKTKHPNNETILKPGSRRYIPSEDVEELGVSMERGQNLPDQDNDSNDDEFDTRKKMAGKVNRKLDRTKTFSSVKEKREAEPWKGYK